MRFATTTCRMLALLSMLATAPLHAQSTADRERQQLAQLQQMVQKLRQENAELQQARAKDVEKARNESRQSLDAELAKHRAGVASSRREARRLEDELARAQEALAQSRVELETLKAELTRREAAATAAAGQRARERAAGEEDRRLLAGRLKANSERAEHCEARHAIAMQVAEDVLDKYEDRQLRACEPFTGLWRVREEDRIQALRDRLFESRLDLPPAPASAPERSK